MQTHEAIKNYVLKDKEGRNVFHYIKGKVISFFESGIILENGGIGYEIHVPQLSINTINKNEEVMIYTVMMVKEDDISLYGFATKDDIDMFKKLLSVNGVGAKAALSIMSTYRTGELKKTILFEDTTALIKAPGIGKKTAQRIILELKDKIGDISGLNDNNEAGSRHTKNLKEEALEALVGLGYTKGEALEAVGLSHEETASVEEIIKSALIKLSRQ